MSLRFLLLPVQEAHWTHHSFRTDRLQCFFFATFRYLQVCKKRIIAHPVLPVCFSANMVVCQEVLHGFIPLHGRQKDRNVNVKRNTQGVGNEVQKISSLHLSFFSRFCCDSKPECWLMVFLEILQKNATNASSPCIVLERQVQHVSGVAYRWQRESGKRAG